MSKYYSINNIFGGSIATDMPIVKARNSREALKEVVGKLPFVRDSSNGNFSVVECDEAGRLHYDRRKWTYYLVKKANRQTKLEEQLKGDK